MHLMQALDQIQTQKPLKLATPMPNNLDLIPTRFLVNMHKLHKHLSLKQTHFCVALECSFFLSNPQHINYFAISSMFEAWEM